MTSRHKCIALQTRPDWTRALQAVPHGFTHTWEHCHAMQLTTQLPTFLYCMEVGNTRIVCPLSERRIDDFTDIVTPSGISGFTGERDLKGFAQYWAEFTGQQEYVCGYIGLNPLFDRSSYVAGAYQHNSIYALDLTLAHEELLARMSAGRRGQLRNWEASMDRLILDRDALRVFLLENHQPFLERIKASSSYYLSTESLAFLCDQENTLLVGAGAPEKIEAVYLFGYTAYAADCLLNVAIPEGRHHTTALLWYGINYFKDLGIPLLNLGGGVQEGDSLAQYKRRLGSTRLALRSLKQVYRADIYAELCRRAGVDPTDLSGYFPAYRKPVVAT